MGNQPLTIAVATDQSYYESGSTITGRVYLSVKDPKGIDAKSLNLLIEGEERTKIHRTSGTGENRRNHYHRSNCAILKLDTPLANFGNGYIKPGQYEFPFISTLPSNIPPTMRENDFQSHCEVRYSIGAHLVQPGGAGGLFSSITKSWLRASPKELNIIGKPQPAGAIAGGIKLPPETESINYCCCFNRGTMTLESELERAILSPGDAANVFLRCRNDSTTPAFGVQAHLRETITWRADGHQETKSRLIGQQFLSADSCPELSPLMRLPQKYFGDASYNPLDDALNRSQRRNLSFFVSRDARDTHQGSLITIDHVLTVTIKTKCCMTNPESSIQVSIQRPPSLTDSAATTAATVEAPVFPSAPPFQSEETNDIPMAEATVLPPDWSALTADLVTIPMAEPTWGATAPPPGAVGSSPYNGATAPLPSLAQPIATKVPY
mmetsp:Transcript_12981/g.19404  ORF Transcript_12981/g.19404 Transcript_12981/m.19404 type:complete len:437 (-) Transcript_12981:330-1640(-)